jgi:hypothetical protein
MQNLLPLLCISREGGRGDEYMKISAKRGNDIEKFCILIMWNY